MRLLLAEHRAAPGRSTLVAGSVLRCRRDRLLRLQHDGEEALSLRPNDVIQWHAIHDAVREGFRRYDFGEVAQENRDLAAFKSKWGTEAIRLYRYYYLAPEAVESGYGSLEAESERLARRLTAAVWRRVPLRATAVLGDRVAPLPVVAEPSNGTRHRLPRRIALLGGTTTGADCRIALAHLADPRRLVRGPAVEAYERSFADRIVRPVRVQLRGGRVGLYFILRSLGIGAGDEVLLQAPTHVVVANAIRYTGARPVYVDVDLATYNIDGEQAGERVTPRTKAVVLQHTFGIPPTSTPCSRSPRSTASR